MKHKYTLIFSLSILFGTTLFSIAHGAGTTVVYEKPEVSDKDTEEQYSDISKEAATSEPEIIDKETQELSNEVVHTVPFYSQFTDISAPEWKKIGCGIASLAMLVDFYSSEEITVDDLLNEGIEAGAYAGDSGWSHAGLIELGKNHGLTGEAVYMNELSMAAAFSKLEEELKEGPVMVSVHYTFEPTNPIPHLVIATGVENGKVHYNDPAEKSSDGTVSVEQFKSAWKKRYIALRP